MGLKVWLPMTSNNLTNQVAGDISFANSGATYASTGGYINTGCYSFNGSSNYVQSSTNMSITGDESFSIAFWMYWNGTSWQNDYVGIVGFGSFSTLSMGFAVIYNGYPALDFWNFRTKANSALSVKTWYHLAFVHKKNTGINGEIYVNGQKVSGTKQGTSGANLDAQIPNIAYNKVLIGKLNDSATRYFNGKLNDIRIYDHTLTAQEVQNLYNKTKNGIYVKVNNTIKKASTIYVKVDGSWKQISLTGRSVNILNDNL